METQNIDSNHNLIDHSKYSNTSNIINLIFNYSPISMSKNNDLDVLLVIVYEMHKESSLIIGISCICLNII